MSPRSLRLLTLSDTRLKLPEDWLGLGVSPQNADALDFKYAHGYIAEVAKLGLGPGLRVVAGR
jgi:hypothetical protein